MNRTAHDRGHTAGYAQALELESDGERLDDGTTWFTCPADEQDPEAYEHGWLEGWSEYMRAREPRQPRF